MRRLSKALAFLGATVFAFTLSACAEKTEGVASFDFDKLEADLEIAAMVPAAQRDTIRIGSTIPYSPAEFYDADNQVVGYEIDAVNALAKVMGIKNVEIVNMDFDSLIPELNAGSIDLAAASIDVNKERLQQANMVAYIQAGYIYGSQAGNPKKFDYANPCGFSLATQADTSQQELIQEISDNCVAEGKSPVKIVADSDQDKLIKQVINGEVDAIIGESPMLKYAAVQNENFATVGEELQVASRGLVTAKNNEALAKAIQAGLQKMMDDGTLKAVLKPWGQESIALNFATLNPPIA